MLHEAGRRKDVFPTILAHELRNPVAPIRNVAAQVVKERRESLPRDLRRMQEIVKRQCPVRAADRWWFRRWSVCLVEDADGVADPAGHVLAVDWRTEVMGALFVWKVFTILRVPVDDGSIVSACHSN